jgi:SAM-dependent methyltransferase
LDPKLAEQHNQAQREYYTHTERATIAPAETPYVRRHIDEILRVSGIQPGARILDAGCGMGRHSFHLAARGYKVEGLELSPDLVARMRQLDRFGIPVHCADIAHPPAELHQGFEAVFGFFMLHHLLDLDAAFRGVAALLRPGGRAVFIEPNPANVLYWIQITCAPHMKWSAERGIFNMRRRLLFPAMERAGLRQPAVFRFGFLPPFLRNLSFGGAIDSAAERVGILEPILPFQIFSADLVHAD